MEEEIRIINDLIEAAVDHGGDWGGPYYCFPIDLAKAINKWLQFRNLQDKYHLIAKEDYDSLPIIVPISVEPDKNWPESYDCRDFSDYCCGKEETDEKPKPTSIYYDSSVRTKEELNEYIDRILYNSEIMNKEEKE